MRKFLYVKDDSLNAHRGGAWYVKEGGRLGGVLIK